MSMASKPPRVINAHGCTFELNVPDHLAPAVLRAIGGMSPHDAAVDDLALPARPRWLWCAVRILRWYRRRVAPLIGQRCVFEPSCSRYAELALRQQGLVRGGLLAAYRLLRCRPGAGGIDAL